MRGDLGLSPCPPVNLLPLRLGLPIYKMRSGTQYPVIQFQPRHAVILRFSTWAGIFCRLCPAAGVPTEPGEIHGKPDCLGTKPSSGSYALCGLKQIT